MTSRLFALDHDHLRTAEVCDLLSCGLPTDEAFADLRSLIVRTSSKPLAKLLGVSRSAAFDPETMIAAAASTNRVIVFFGIRAEEGRFIGRYADSTEEAFDGAEDELRGAAVVPQTVWSRIAAVRKLKSGYEEGAVRRFVVAELDRVLIGYLNESLYEARMTDLLSKQTLRVTGYPSVKEVQTAARKTWPLWRHFVLGTLSTDEPEHADLKYWRDLRGERCDVGFVVRRDLFEEYLNKASEEVRRIVEKVIPAAISDPAAASDRDICLAWTGIDWSAAGGQDFETAIKAGLKPYAYRFVRLRSVTGDIVSVHGTVVSPRFMHEKQRKPVFVTV